MNITISAYYVLSNKCITVTNITINYINPVFLNSGNSVDIWKCLETFLMVKSGTGGATGI